MQKLADIPVDSYPVGLDISQDGKWLISTSQGRNSFGGNCVDIFKLSGLKPNNEITQYSDAEPIHSDEFTTDVLTTKADAPMTSTSQREVNCILVGMLFLIAIIIFVRQLESK